MNITQVRCFRLTGAGNYGATEERKVDMLDAYPEFVRRSPIDRTPGGRLEAIYVEVLTDGGASGLFGPIFEETVPLIHGKLAPKLVGRDPLAYELLWDILYRHSNTFGSGGARGYQMMAISAVDCALWDLRGKFFNLPVYRLLGGPTRPHLTCYASMLGYSLDDDLVQERARGMADRGFPAQKWFFRYGPADGTAGMERNRRLAQIVREAVGPDVDIMFDCSMAWNATYTIRMIERIAEFRPLWIEEPFPPELVSDIAFLRRSTHIPIATGEHEYTRWGIHKLFQAGAIDVVQTDPEWCGGITEMVKICALASAYGRQVFPHGHSAFAALNVIAAQPPTLCPMLEFLCCYQPLAQHFHRCYIEPLDGTLSLPTLSGLGFELDDAKIEHRDDL